ncbi:hypothetical protein BGZ82_002433 [Podila clonocystis]|nr:hypothetical protein BGZ82_002433 [Podila clonocystis]
MVKPIFLLSTFFTSFAFATDYYYVAIFNNAGKSQELQTARIMNYSGSDVKLFSSSDCTGNYDKVADNAYNAQWVNSMSYGRSGISSESPDGCGNLWN